MKTREYKNKKDYRRHVRAMIAGGKVNLDNGNWTDASAADPKVEQRAKSQALRFQ